MVVRSWESPPLLQPPSSLPAVSSSNHPLPSPPLPSPGKQIYLGYFSDDADAARAVDTFCGTRGLPKVNAAVLSGDAEPGDKTPSSIYSCVTWNKRSRKWRARIKHDGSLVQLGTFIVEADAARAVDTAWAERGRPQRNAALLVQSGEAPAPQGENPVVELPGNAADAAQATRRAAAPEDRNAAAAAADVLAGLFGGGGGGGGGGLPEPPPKPPPKKRKLPGSGGGGGGPSEPLKRKPPGPKAKREPGLTSSFQGVSWDKHSRKWRAYIYPSGKQVHLGSYSDEEAAARAADAAWAERGQPRRNAHLLAKGRGGGAVGGAAKRVRRDSEGGWV